MAKPREQSVRKNFRLSQSKLDRARKILGTASETETVERALDLVAFGAALQAGIERAHGAEWVDVFGDMDG